MKRSKAVKERRWTESEIKLVLETDLPLKDMTNILNRTEGSINMIRRKARMVIEGKGAWEGDQHIAMIRKVLMGKYGALR